MSKRHDFSDLRSQAFFRDLGEDAILAVQSCSTTRRVVAGTWVARLGDPADDFYVLQSGSLGVVFPAPHTEITIQTLGIGDVVGWSWLMPPHEWQFDIKAVMDSDLIRIDGRRLREKCEQDNQLGYALMKRLSLVMVERLRATRLQLMDVYGPKK